MAKLKVLTVQFNVTGFTDEEIEELRFAAEVQGEDASDEQGDASILNSGVKEIDLDLPDDLN